MARKLNNVAKLKRTSRFGPHLKNVCCLEKLLASIRISSSSWCLSVKFEEWNKYEHNSKKAADEFSITLHLWQYKFLIEQLWINSHSETSNLHKLGLKMCVKVTRFTIVFNQIKMFTSLQNWRRDYFFATNIIFCLLNTLKY